MIRQNGVFAPERMCIACRKREAKNCLLRLVFEEGRVCIDAGGKSQRRGVYLCRSAACVGKAQKTRALSRAFKCAVEESVYEMLAGSIQEG